MVEFVGRERELVVLDQLMGAVRSAVGSPKPGRCLLIRGRRRIGKSSLVETFVDRAGAPAVFFTAAGAAADVELEALQHAVASSSLPDRDVFAEAVPGNWSAAFRQLAGTLPDDQPSIVVLDEVPYLMDRVDAFEGLLQRAWDRDFCRKPVLLILIGSDLSMMEALGSYGRPFHQRGQELVLGPLNPAEVGQMLALDAAEAFDATLVTGGLPLICAAWQPGEDLWTFLARELANPVSALLVSAERSLAAEFPESANARNVLTAIGTGERTFTNIAQAAGRIAHTSLTRSIEVLTGKRMVVAELPIWTRPSKERRYRVTDPYLRFWLRFIGPNLPEIERLRGDLTLARVRASWTSWRGRAVEPLLRESLARLLPDGDLPAAQAVGGYWNRSNTIEVDIVGADRAPVAAEIHFLGSIKWLERSAFDSHDLAALQKHRAALTDEPIPLMAISRGEVTASGLTAVYGPVELLAAWTSFKS
ncbi:ATP-binding protein [Frankia sp. AgB1.9]|uniref:ATP-binding protein n=1 Tax=unclassified Frankia TaxID=2632575 RepID=UPI0019320BEE|nr:MULTISPECIES: ATP-binding protein [unclassified Frankia]MBL7488273.1 ATP-binding protein [Frankia sp. AgW1.1]MBL7548084.1 ATP-binding protein [Frankia sp. AgB1.9]MBL7620310.1 ATP-binding protein [Frankia sp. AgB1.8]